MGKSDDNRCYVARGYWNPLARAFKDLTHLNDETPKGTDNFTFLVMGPIVGINQCDSHS